MFSTTISIQPFLLIVVVFSGQRMTCQLKIWCLSVKASIIGIVVGGLIDTRKQGSETVIVSGVGNKAGDWIEPDSAWGMMATGRMEAADWWKIDLIHKKRWIMNSNISAKVTWLSGTRGASQHAALSFYVFLLIRNSQFGSMTSVSYHLISRKPNYSRKTPN